MRVHLERTARYNRPMCGRFTLSRENAEQLSLELGVGADALVDSVLEEVAAPLP